MRSTKTYIRSNVAAKSHNWTLVSTASLNKVRGGKFKTGKVLADGVAD